MEIDLHAWKSSRRHVHAVLAVAVLGAVRGKGKRTRAGGAA
jgi:hypothetical protein